MTDQTPPRHTIKLKDIFDDLLNLLLITVDCDLAVLYKAEEKNDDSLELIKIAVASNLQSPQDDLDLDISLPDSLLTTIVNEKKPVYLEKKIEQYLHCNDPLPSMGSFWAIPMFSRQRIQSIVFIANRSKINGAEFQNRVLAWSQACIQTINLRKDSSLIEKTLYEKEIRYRTILDNTMDAVITTNVHGNIIAANSSSFDIFGYTFQELANKQIQIIMPERFRQDHSDQIEHYLKTGQSDILGKRRELAGMRKSGEEFPIDLTINEFQLEGERFFTGIIRDITQQKLAEKKEAEARLILKKSRDDLLLVLNKLQIGTIVLDEDGTISFISEACESIEGVSRQTSLGKLWEDELPFNEKSRTKLKQLLKLPADERSRAVLTLKETAKTQQKLEVDVWNDPRSPQRHIVCIYDMTEVYRLRNEVKKTQYDRLIGNSEPMLRMYEMFEQVARGEWTVLIEGETGVGKELVARSIHAASNRSSGPFIAVNCAGLTETLLADQLFGHRKGAFTGATSDQEGIFEAASGGTLFLDEIGEIPLSMQSSLLRVLQEHEIVRVGEVKPRKVDVRILAATNRNLTEMTDKGLFREDLLYRIRVARIMVPPLRERKEDIPVLIEAFLAESRIASGKPGVNMGKSALNNMMTYHWPGNVRELKNAIDYCVIHCRQSEIKIEDLPPEILTLPKTNDIAADIVSLEKREIQVALEKAGGNRSKAARFLGISRSTFYRRLRQLGIDVPD